MAPPTPPTPPTNTTTSTFTSIVETPLPAVNSVVDSMNHSAEDLMMTPQNEENTTNEMNNSNKKAKKTSDDEASTILLSLKTTNDNSEAATSDEASSATPVSGKEISTPIPPPATSLTTTSTSATTLTPLPDTVLPATPALAGAEVLDEAEYNRRMTLEYLRQYFHLPLNEVAQLWGVSKPAFKKLCRQHGIKRWPSRQVSSIISSITMLQNFCQENELPDKILKEYEARLAVLHTSLEQIMQVLTPSLLSSILSSLFLQGSKFRSIFI
jgi:hypothetical protein